MSAAPEPAAPVEGNLELGADQAVEACGGEAREAGEGAARRERVLEKEIAELRAAVSKGYSRGHHVAQRGGKE